MILIEQEIYLLIYDKKINKIEQLSISILSTQDNKTGLGNDGFLNDP